ncbi:conserved membrane protein of unknown function [Tenacibaculum sp. 190524A02b]|uniref:hypothetical protein n=1 Tax=Tenacibaculum vairaonense TaxID=3137860 RepID=UPI0032B159A9
MIRKDKYSLEEKITSLRAISLTVLMYIFGYAFKLTVLFNSLLTERIPSIELRFTTSFFTGVAISSILLFVSIHEVNKKVPYVISVMDSIILLLVFDVFNSSGFKEVFTVVFISLFMAFVGYQLINVFVAKLKEEKAKLKQSFREIEQEFSEKKQEVIKLERKLAELKEHTCEYCEEPFNSKNALNAHKGKCKYKPNK